MKKLISVFFLISLFSVFRIWAINTEPRFYEAPYKSVESILNSPAAIYFDVSDLKGSNELLSLSDIHAVYPIKAEWLFQILLDPKKVEDSFTDLKSVKNIPISGGGIYHYFQNQKIEISAMGITKSYEYLLEIRNDISDDSREFKSSWKLENSPDSTFSEVSGSWYIKEFSYAGKTCSYVRHFATSTIAKPFPGQKTILRLFSKARMEKTVEELYIAAVKDQGR